MPTTRTESAATSAPHRGARTAAAPARRLLSTDERLDEALLWLKRHASKATREGMARYAIPSEHALGVSMGQIQQLGKQLGRDHDLAQALWDSGIYEARMLAAYVAEPERLTAAQMDRWCRDFDNWAICDTLCFALFDRSPHAWRKVEQWSVKREEFVKRAGFALLASLALHGKGGDDARFAPGLQLIEREAGDERNFVKKGVSWALRSIGRRNAAMHAQATALAQKLAASAEPAARWVGKDAIRDLQKQAARRASKG